MCYAASVEYNPLQPNDYEDVLKERRVKAAQRKKEEEMERRRREMQKFDEREGVTRFSAPAGDLRWCISHLSFFVSVCAFVHTDTIFYFGLLGSSVLNH